MAIKNFISPKDRVVTAEMANFLSVTQVIGELDLVTEVNESLQIRSQAMAFASSSSGNKTFTVNDEVGHNFKMTFQKPKEKFTAKRSNNLRTRSGSKPHYSRTLPVLSKKVNSSEKEGHFSKTCRNKPQGDSGMCKQNNFCEEENNLSGQAMPLAEIKTVYTNELIFKMSVT